MATGGALAVGQGLAPLATRIHADVAALYRPHNRPARHISGMYPHPDPPSPSSVRQVPMGVVQQAGEEPIYRALHRGSPPSMPLLCAWLGLTGVWLGLYAPDVGRRAASSSPPARGRYLQPAVRLIDSDSSIEGLPIQNRSI